MLAKSTSFKRLTSLAVMLETIAANKRRRRGFNLRTWFSNKGTWTASSDRPECGTTACAGGFAAVYKPFRQLGLSLERIGASVTPSFKGARGYSALSQFFGIDYATTHDLFDPSNYSERDHNNPEVVATRVRQVLPTLK